MNLADALHLCPKWKPKRQARSVNGQWKPDRSYIEERLAEIRAYKPRLKRAP